MIIILVLIGIFFALLSLAPVLVSGDHPARTGIFLRR
jgi:hypothetical protein